VEVTKRMTGRQCSRTTVMMKAIRARRSPQVARCRSLLLQGGGVCGVGSASGGVGKW
jgi:hypothetical protein